MKTRNARAIAWMMASALSLALFSCAGDSQGVSGASGSGGTTGQAVAQVLPGLGIYPANCSQQLILSPNTSLLCPAKLRLHQPRMIQPYSMTLHSGMAATRSRAG